MYLGFEFDFKKSVTNLEKHGISLQDAMLLWTVRHTVTDARQEMGEMRFMVIGQLEGKSYTCVFTIRNKMIRIISARRSRIYEEKIYYEKFKTEADHGGRI